MPKFIEIKPKQYPELRYEYHCPKCGNGLVYGLIPCPDGRVGCCVAHYAYTCVKCGTQFGVIDDSNQETPDDPNP